VEQSIPSALTLVIAVSVAVERVTEILKQMFPVLAKEQIDETKEQWRRAALQMLAAVIGTVIAWFGNLSLGSHSGTSTYVLIGLMSSGGSGFLNHALDAVRALKVTQEATAKEAVAKTKPIT